MGRSRSRVTHLVKCVRKATEIMNCSVSVEAVEGHNTLFPVRRYDQDRGRSKGEKRGQRFEERPRRTVANRKAWSTVAKDRKSVVSGKMLQVRVDVGGSRIMKKHTNKTNKTH